MEIRKAISDDPICPYCQNPNGCSCTSTKPYNVLDKALRAWDTERCLNCGRPKRKGADLCEVCAGRSRDVAKFKRKA